MSDDTPKPDLSFQPLMPPDPPSTNDDPDITDFSIDPHGELTSDSFPPGTFPIEAASADLKPTDSMPAQPPPVYSPPPGEFAPMPSAEPPATFDAGFEPLVPPEPPPTVPISTVESASAFESSIPTFEPPEPGTDSAIPEAPIPTFDSPEPGTDSAIPEAPIPTFDASEPGTDSAIPEPPIPTFDSPATFADPPPSFDSPATFDSSAPSFESPATFAEPAATTSPSPDTKTDIIMPPDPPPPGQKSSGRWKVLAIPLVLIALIGGSLFFYFRMLPDMPKVSQAPTVEPVAPPPPEAQPAPPPPEAEADVPTLETSDDMVRTLLGSLSDHPRLPFWLEVDDLARRGVVSVVNMADGESPQRHLKHLDPGRGFETEYGRDMITPQISARSFARYDLPARVISSFESEPLARLYQHRFRAICEEAYRELGYPEGSFDDVLLRALDRLIATPIPDGPYVLQRRVTSWAFADPELEALDGASKQLLRMGPKNARRVQASLRDFRSALLDVQKEAAAENLGAKEAATEETGTGEAPAEDAPVEAAQPETGANETVGEEASGE